GFGDVQVGVEEDLQGGAQVFGVGIAVDGQALERLAGEVAQLGRVGDQGEQAVDAEGVEVDDRAGAVEAAAHAHGAAGFLVGGGEACDGRDGAGHAGGEGAAAASAGAGDLGDHASDQGVGVVAGFQYHDDFLVEAGHRRAAVAGGDDGLPGGGEA